MFQYSKFCMQTVFNQVAYFRSVINFQPDDLWFVVAV